MNTSQLIIIANRLSMKAMRSESYESLSFILLNDTIHMIRYDQAHLLKVEKGKVTLEGVSGHTDFKRDSQKDKMWEQVYQHLVDPNQPKAIHWNAIKDIENTASKLHIQPDAKLMWIPISVSKDLIFILFMQKNPSEEPFPDEQMKVLQEFLLPGYALALKQKHEKSSLRKLGDHILSKKGVICIAVFLSLFIIRVPLRVVAPCEVVPEDPFVITAPLDGIIEEIMIDPGQNVLEGDRLFEYDKRVPLRKLKVAQKEVDILQSEVDRAITLGLNKDPQSLKDLAVLKLKLEKEKLELDLAEVQASQLTVTSPITGIAIIDNPNEWSGKPVVVGEKVMSVTNPKQSKIEIWIPEKDNILFDPKEPVKVFLNVSPEITYLTTLTYVSIESSLNAEEVPSFLAEADWLKPPEEVKIGLEGTAVLYGNYVSLFYYIFRKPWSYIRYFFGV